MIIKYRKKPIEIEGIEWTGNNEKEIKDFIEINQEAEGKVTIEGDILKIPTLAGIMSVNLGDTIIKGIEGECYPIKPDILSKTYEKIENKKSSFSYINYKK